MYGASRFIIHFVFFFNDTATTEIYTLSLHDALPISLRRPVGSERRGRINPRFKRNSWSSDPWATRSQAQSDRKSTRLNSSHVSISYAVFCLKKKKIHPTVYHTHRLIYKLRSHDVCPD